MSDHERPPIHRSDPRADDEAEETGYGPAAVEVLRAMDPVVPRHDEVVGVVRCTGSGHAVDDDADQFVQGVIQ